ncbi:MAG: hypothetical protein AB8F34_02085 [Akkermansiaceae bacterium]
MSRNTILALVALLLVALFGGAGAFWAYKKYKQKQNQEFRFEGSMGTAREGFDPKVFKAMILDQKVMSDTVAKHDLVSVWSVADEAAAVTKLQKKFSVSVSEGTVKVSYQDKDKDLAKAILESIVKAYYSKHQDGQ